MACSITCSDDVYTNSFVDGYKAEIELKPIEKHQLIGLSLKECLKHFPMIDTTNLPEETTLVLKGNQEKWFHPDLQSFIKTAFEYDDMTWKDYLCEVIASKLGKQLNLDVVPASFCKILHDGDIVPGSYTYNFLNDGEEFISAYRIFVCLGSSIAELSKNMTVCDRIKWVLDRLNEFTGLDLSDYINRMIVIDFLVGNEDRHLNNFGVISNRDTGEFRMAPIFDNGLSLLEHDRRYLGAPLQFSLKKMDGKPFCKSLKRAYEESRQMFPEVPKVDLDLGGLILPSRRAFDYLKYSSEVMGLRLVASKEVYVIG